VTRRTTIEIDDVLLARAQAALGTKGLRDTVTAAFSEAIRRSLREELADRVATGAGVDRSPEVLRDSRPTR
jgi:Arc/MetJ family transcription regulator